MILAHALADPLLVFFAVMVTGAGLNGIGFVRLGRLAMVLAVATLYLLSTPFVGQRLLAWLEVGTSPPVANSAEQAEAIVVLSATLRRNAPEYDGDTLGSLTLERMRYGAALHRRTGLPILVTGGSIARSQDGIGRIMAEAYRSEFQIDVGWIEERARNTFENAALSKEILDRQGIEKVYLVTHAWHMRRAAAAFEHVGLEAIPAGTGFTRLEGGLYLADFVPRSAVLAASARGLHEWIGWIWYELAYF